MVILGVVLPVVMSLTFKTKGIFMDIQALKAVLVKVMPLLTVNLVNANKEYLKGDLPRGAFEYVRNRHFDANLVLNRDDIVTENAFAACAMLAIDLRSVLADKTVNTGSDVVKLVEDWWKCYTDNGFTEVNEFFIIPKLPAKVVEA